MILSRTIEHLKQQHWTGVFIELVIVILGVFIGIQVSNWNQSREDARLGQDYVRRLTFDLKGDLVKAREQTVYYENVFQAVQHTAEVLKEQDSDPKDLVISAYRATEVIFRPPNLATWNQIVSSGHLELLPKGAIEGGLADYYAYNGTLDAYNQLKGARYRRLVRSIIPISIQKAIRAGCSDIRDSEGFAFRFMKQCKLDADPALVRSTAQALRNNPKVATALRFQYSLLASGVPNFKANVTVISKALAALGVHSDESKDARP
ncbi:MAG TPA: hypothetical protein VJ998_05155 [Pseudomonadales bacterium]|nr:hypothetical protein [Pseudomonadales bacterium]